MKKKYKMTGCARLIIFIIIFAPIAYLAASYYNGQDGIEQLKKLLGIEKVKSSEDEGATEDMHQVPKDEKNKKSEQSTDR